VPFLTALIDRIDVGANRIDSISRPTHGSAALLDVLSDAIAERERTMKFQILSIPVRLRPLRAGRITMRDRWATDTRFATGEKPDARLNQGC